MKYLLISLVLLVGCATKQPVAPTTPPPPQVAPEHKIITCDKTKGLSPWWNVQTKQWECRQMPQ